MKSELNHGSTSTYVNHKCRCTLCRKAWTDYTQAAKRRRIPKEQGTTNTYFNYRCRCSLCKRAASEYGLNKRNKRNKSKDVTRPNWKSS